MVDTNILHDTDTMLEEVDGIHGPINAIDDDVKLLDENDLPGCYSSCPRDGGVELTYAETQKLVKCLHDTTYMLTQHLGLQQNRRERRPQALRSSRPRCPTVKSFLSRSLYTITGAKGISATIILQLVCLVMLTLVDSIPQSADSKHLALQWGSNLMMVLQIINLIIVIIISIQLAKQITKRRVNAVLLVQSYLATILVFAGIYTATYRMDFKSWKFVGETTDAANPVMIVILYTRFLFFSVSTATLCGAADALPKEWYTCLFASIQMLLSFLYFTSVLGTAVFGSNKPGGANNNRMEDDLVEYLSMENDVKELRKDLKELHATLVDIDNKKMNNLRQ